MPIRCLFVRTSDAAQHGLTESSSGKLDAVGRTVGREPDGRQIAGTPARSIGIVNSLLRRAFAGPEIRVISEYRWIKREDEAVPALAQFC